MRLSRDPKIDAACIRRREKRFDDETIEITSDFPVDIDETGAVCGIERLKPNGQLTVDDDVNLVLRNQLDDTQAELRLA
jgi:uncharacterized protein YuzE